MLGRETITEEDMKGVRKLLRVADQENVSLKALIFHRKTSGR